MAINNPLDDFARYDEMPYTSYPFPETHPSRLSAIAKIFGLNPPPLEHARVLELGCASGGNLTPLAIYYPNMTLVGVDYSSVQINEGIQTILQLGLGNVTLKHMSVTEITPELGTFDYIICHGVYSWVPQEAQAAILRVCHENLAPNGLAYVSYNVYPGWKVNEITRDAMLFHTRNITQPSDQVAHGCGMIQYMQEMSPEGSVFRHIMDHESTAIQQVPPYYIAHEFLETHNSPCYFHEFNRRCEDSHLLYLADTQIASMFVERLGEEHKQRLLSVSEGQQILLEQYLDFINNRAFRQTILVQKNNNIVTRTINKENLKKIAYVSNHQRLKEPGLPAGAQKFTTAQNRIVLTHSPTQQAALKVLGQNYPNPVTYDAWVKQIREIEPHRFNENDLLDLIERSLIIAFIQPWDSTFETTYLSPNDTAPTKPLINKQLAQHALATGHLSTHLHYPSQLNPVMNVLLPLLDGNHTIEQLIQAVVTAALDNQIHFIQQDTTVIITDLNQIELEAKVHAQNSLIFLQTNGYLIKQ